MTETAADRMVALTSPGSRPPAQLGRLSTTLLVLPAAALLLTPFALLGQAAVAQPGILMILADKPVAAVQIALGLLLAVLFCTLPFCRLAKRPADGEAEHIGGAPIDPEALPASPPVRHPLAA